LFVQVQHLRDEGDHAIVPGDIGGISEVDDTDCKKK